MSHHVLRKKNSRDIILHTESHFYLPGDEIVGTVTYHPKKQVSLRFVKVIFGGEEFCIWIDKVAARVGGPIAASRAPLFRKESNLLTDRTRVDAGPHTWQFRFVIPRSIPPTCNYNGKASVSYWLKAKAATSFGHFDARFRYPVTIGQFWIPTVPLPIQTTHNLSGGSVVMSVKSSHSVVKCGDTVNLEVHFENTSYRNLTGVRVKLKQVWECTGVFYHKNIVFKYFTKEGYPTTRGPHTTNIPVKIPNRLQTCPTVSNASLFKCTYHLCVYGISKMAGGLVATDTIKCRSPLTISNLPATENELESNPSPSARHPRPPRNVFNNTNNNSDSSDEDSNDSEREDELNANRGRRDLRQLDRRANQSDSNLARTIQSNISSSSSSTSSFNSSRSLPRSASHPSRLVPDAQGNYPSEENTSDVDIGTFFTMMDMNKPDMEKYKESANGEVQVKKENDNNNDDEDRAKECIVCYDGAKNMLLLPCAHIATCNSCTQYIMHTSKQCPVCRTKISQTMRIYPV